MPSTTGRDTAFLVDLDAHIRRIGREFDTERTGNQGFQTGFRQAAFFPFGRHFAASANFQSFETAAFPGGRQGGKQFDFSRLLCTSISAIPAQPPKLPSIWKGGCAQNRFGYVPPPFVIFVLRSTHGRSRSTNNFIGMVAVMQTRPEIHLPPIDHPVLLSPRAISDLRAASASSGVRSVDISLPGYSP